MNRGTYMYCCNDHFIQYAIIPSVLYIIQMKQTNYFKPGTNKTCSQKTIKTKNNFLFTFFLNILFTAWLALPHDELGSLLSIKLITLGVGLGSHDSLGISPYGNSVMSVYFSFMSVNDGLY